MQLAELLEQGRMLRRENRIAAMEYFEQCIRDAEVANDKVFLAIASAELALELIGTRQASALLHARDLLDQAEALLKTSKNCALELFYVWYCQGSLELQAGNYEVALSHLQAAYQGYINDARALSLIDDALGQYYTFIDNLSMAASHFEQALTRRQSASYEVDRAVSYQYLGDLYYQLEKYDEAEAYFGQSLDLALQWNDVKTRMLALRGLARIAIAQAHWETAGMLFEEALQLAQEPLDTCLVAHIYIDLANVLLNTHQVLAAQACLEDEALPRLEKLQNEYSLALGNQALGKVYTHRLLEGLDELSEETIENAEDHFLEASITFEHQHKTQDYARVLYDLAFLYNVSAGSKYRFQYQGKAIRCLELALSILEDSNAHSTHLSTQVEKLLNQMMGQLSF